MKMLMYKLFFYVLYKKDMQFGDSFFNKMCVFERQSC